MSGERAIPQASIRSGDRENRYREERDQALEERDIEQKFRRAAEETRDQARAKLERIRGALLAYAAMMETTADHVAPNGADPSFYRMVAQDIRTILAAEVPTEGRSSS